MTMLNRMVNFQCNAIRIIFLISIILDVISATQIKERFKRMSRNNVVRWAFMKGGSIQAYSSVAAPLLKGLNMTLSPQTRTTLGVPSPNGSYDGLIGVIQRREADFMWNVVRYDSIPFNPGILIPSVLDDDQPRLISNITTDGKNTEISVMFIWENFPQEFWMYWATGLLMILITTICITWVMNMRITIGKSLEETYSYIWNNYFLNVGQVPDPSYDYSSKTILWFTIIIATFYVIHCTLFNTLSADMTVTSPPRRIESLEDFFDYETFGELTPIISSTSNTYISLKHARKGLEIRLFNKIESNRFSSLVETTTSGENKRITNRIFLKEGVLITDYNIFRLYFLSIYCHIEPLKFSDIKISKGTLTGGIYGMLLAHGTDPEVIKLLNYRIMQLREMKTHDDAIKRSTETYLSLGGISFTFAGYQCLDTIDRKIQEDGIPTDWISIDIAFFADLIKFCFFVQLASIVILMFDRSYHELKGYWQSWHAQKSTHRQSTLFIVRSQPNEKGIIPMPENSRMSRINECDIEEL